MDAGIGAIWKRAGVAAAAVLMLLLGIGVGRLSAGSPDSPGDPNAAAAQMFSLDQIYARLVTGTVPVTMTVFTEPSTPPGIGTMHTLSEIMARIPPEGTSFQGPEGLRTFLIPDGLYRTVFGPGIPQFKTATANDSDLVADNLRFGVDIFGVVGTAPPGAPGKTGQTNCYDATVNVIPCFTNLAQDGAYQKGASVSPRFVVNGPGPLEGPGTVADRLTGLVWVQNANCFPGPATWAQAINFVIQINNGLCGVPFNQLPGADWRLPNVKELFTLTDFGHNNPAVPPGMPFTNFQNGRYWTGTNAETGIPAELGNAWNIDFAVGTVNRQQSKNNSYFVLPVRGGQ